ncbi:MAG: type I DNA topoisomerase [Thermoguttaceae bacterium]|jgi:DNA topoisomerase-1|nr:type I DNA topoisomerase [Thermoguttaceae bacterium]
MAKKAASQDRTSLVIVESPAKARTISRFLGRGFTIEASIGHVRDLPQGAKEIPDEYKGKQWAHLGVDVEQDFRPVYVVPPEKRKQVAKLRQALKRAKDLYLATDEDREGEAISWHLCEVLKPQVPVHRLVFHEITKEAILEALTNPRQVDESLVRAQEARRILDRLFGYEVSPLLWRKVGSKLSAGRVQSVAVRLIVDRERQRMAFVPASWWDLWGTFAKRGGEAFQAELISVGGRRIPASRDFDPATGQPKEPSLLVLTEQEAAELAARLQNAPCRVAALEDKPYTSRPYPPFTTSTLQQEANRKFGFTARKTMQLAQSLYENGHITYMRTDSTNLAEVAIEAARDLVAQHYGREYLPDQPRYYRTKVKNAQEAHEAIRPAGHPFDLPDTLRGELSADEFRLYDLIWKRTVASQMADARGRRVTITVALGDAEFQASGTSLEFPGYLRAYVEGADDPEAELADRETLLPAVEAGETLEVRGLEAKGHTTQPPNRYSEATLTRALEEKGIGRPSTYAAIIDTILNRNYVFKRGNQLVPTWTAFAVCQLLESHLPDLVDYEFTAQMEDELDAISRGEKGHIEYLKNFYYGNTHPGLKEQLQNKTRSIDARQISRVLIGKPAGEGAEEIYVRVGKYGPRVEQGDRWANIPEGMAPDELTVPVALELLDRAQQSEEPLGHCPETGKPVFLKMGRFGPYVQRGTADDGEKPQSASLLKGMKPEEVTLSTALALLSLPRSLGVHPQTGEPVMACNGRFGPYVKCGQESRSLPNGLSPLDVTLEQALDLLAKPKPPRGAARRSEPIRVFEASPVTGQPVQLLSGRYGPYVTDGVTNASLPKTLAPEEVTFERALELLAERAAKGPAKRPARRTYARGTARSASPSAKKKAAPRAKQRSRK